MATQATNGTNGTSGTSGTSGTQDAATIGVGGATSGEAGATPQHETQQETGGSGGARLTHSTGEIDAAPGSRTDESPAAPEPKPEADGSAVQSGARGSLDTRSQQAGGTGTGLGSPETGANQSQDDLPPAR